MTITRNNLSIGNIIKGAANDLLDSLLGFPTQNILHQYRTFNYRVTLAIVSNAEYKSQSYKATGFDYIVFQSHGKNSSGATPGGSQVLNQIQSFVNMVSTGGKNSYNFYLEDLRIKSFVSGARDWATELRMKIIEPYSIDTFLSSIMTGLTAKGYYTLDKSCNFILKIDFVGYKDDEEEPSVIPYTTRYYPIYITELNANLTQAGTTYEIVGAPMNDTARLDDVNIIQESLSLTGKTVGDMMKSLELAIQKVKEDNREKTELPQDQYKIIFVDEDGKPASKSITAKIRDEKMFEVFEDVGTKVFLKDKTSYIKKQAVTTIATNDNKEEFELTVSADGRKGLTNIIDSIIAESYFVVDRLKKEFVGSYDEDGQVPWWRVVTEIENGEWIKSRGVYQKIVTLKIIPRKVHFTKLTSTFRADHVSTPADFNSMVCRNYEWNYTGNNKDIISFNLNFNQLWSKIISGNYGKKSTVNGSNTESAKDGKILSNPDGTAKPVLPKQASAAGYAPATIAGTITTEDKVNNSSKENQIRSSAETNPFFDIARDVNSIINNPYEQLSLTMEILGDPMWLGTQFIDNRSVVGKVSNLFTVDGGNAFRTVDPTIRVIAYAPRDVNSQGYIAAEKGEDRSMSRYSAYYTINEVESSFNGGVFKQTLKGYRNPNQDLSTITTGDRINENRIDLSIRK